MSQRKQPKPLPELNVTCTSTDCDNDLHCFLQKQRKAGPHGPCRQCGADLVDWSRLHARDLKDVDHTFEALKRERIRHHYFHRESTQHAVNYAQRAGAKALDERVRKRVRNSIGPAQPYRDGAQTPVNGKNPIHDAQHATATCCRRCFEYWYGIPVGGELTERELDYASELILRFLNLRYPDLPDEPQKIPPIRNT